MAQRELGSGQCRAECVHPGLLVPLRDADVILGPWKQEARSVACPEIRSEMERGKPRNPELYGLSRAGLMSDPSCAPHLLGNLG